MAFSPTNFLLGLPTNPGFVAAGGAAPAITSDGGGATADVSVNTGDTAVTTVVASDTGTITYSIVGGAEALMFEIDPDTGELAFTETSVDGEYEVIVAATSDWGTDTQTITVTVEEVYHADAVHFDFDEFLSNASLTCTDNAFYSLSVWVKVEFVGTYLCISHAEDWPSGIWGGDENLELQVGDDAGNNFAALTTSNPFTNVWRHLLMSCDMSGAGVMKVYISDVAETLTLGANFAPFTIVGNGLPFRFNEDTQFDAAEIWIAPGVSLLDGGGDIPLATRRKFISAAGKPVDLGADGSLPTGTAPAIFFSGNAAAFSTNRGTGGAFTLTGTLSNAATSPSD